MLTGSKVVVIGGSSGIGLEIARSAAQAQAEVTVAGRSKERLDRAMHSLKSLRIEGFVADIGDLSAVRRLFAAVGSFDHLVVTAADLVYGRVRDLTEQDLMRAVRSKFLGPVFAVQQAADRIRPGGSIT